MSRRLRGAMLRAAGLARGEAAVYWAVRPMLFRRPYVGALLATPDWGLGRDVVMRTKQASAAR